MISESNRIFCTNTLFFQNVFRLVTLRIQVVRTFPHAQNDQRIRAHLLEKDIISILYGISLRGGASDHQRQACQARDSIVFSCFIKKLQFFQKHEHTLTQSPAPP